MTERDATLFDTARAADVIGVSRATVHKWVQAGALSAVRPADAPAARNGKSRQGPVPNRYDPEEVRALARRWRAIKPHLCAGRALPVDIYRDDAALDRWLAERRAQRERWAKPPKPAEPLYFATDAAGLLGVGFTGLDQLAALGALHPVPWPNSSRRPRYLVREVRALAEQYAGRGVPLPADLVSTDEAAEIVGSVSAASVGRLASRGLLPVVGRFRGGKVFRRVDVEGIRDAYPSRGITSAVARDIVRRVLAGEHPRDVAADLNLKQQRVCSIARGASWRWATADLLPKRKNRRAA